MEIKSYMTRIGQQAREAASLMAKADTATKNRALLFIAQAIRREVALLRAANRKDLDIAKDNGLEAALLDRLTLSDKAIETMATGLEQIASLDDPIGAISNLKLLPSGIQVGQMRVPLGVIGIIYEARPNVTVDAAGLCIKSGNATILRGGSEAIHCNQVLAGLVREGLAKAGLPEQAVQVVETTDRTAVGELITMTEYVDVIVPRGGKGLIERLMRESKIPMIKHLDGICHIYIDDSADLDKAVEIGFNAKCQRYGTCNTMETLLVSENVAADVLPLLATRYRDEEVELTKRHSRYWALILISPKQRKRTGKRNISPRYWLSALSAVWMKPSLISTVTHPSIPTPSLRKTTAIHSAFCARWIRLPS